MRRTVVLLVAAAFLSLPAVSPTWGEPASVSVAWTTDQCREAALFSPTRYANVALLVPEPYADNVIRAGVPGLETATLIFTVNQCTNNTLVSQRGTFSADRATELIVGVLLSGAGDDAVQFYTLANYVDWQALATAFNALGLPTVHVPNLQFDLAVDPFVPAGVLSVDVPAPGEHISVRGKALVLHPPTMDAHADQFAVGPRGSVHVEHHAPVIGVNPGATATVSSSRPDGVSAQAMGGTQGRAEGFLFEKGPGHSHTATLLR